jgi:tetratricopeptide (TPR) repeat protein
LAPHGGLHIHRFEPAQAIEAFERALRLSPLDPMSFYARQGIGEAHLIEGRLEEALQFSQQALSERPRDHMLKRRVCALLAVTGEIEQARRLVPEILAQHPHLTLELLVSAAGRHPCATSPSKGCGWPDSPERRLEWPTCRERPRHRSLSCSGGHWLVVRCSCCADVVLLGHAKKLR